MNFELLAAASVHVERARACARDILAPVTSDFDRTGQIPRALRETVQAVMSADVCSDDVTFAAVVEELASVSAAAALTAAGGALGAAGVARAEVQWPGLRGADIDGLRAQLSGSPQWQIAVTAVFIGLARAAVELTTSALGAARTAGTPNEWAEAALADAATASDAAQLLLRDGARAGRTGEAASAARGMARLQALEAVTLAMTAAERATGPEASRPGEALERISRDATTMTRVLGDVVEAQAAVAGSALPG